MDALNRLRRPSFSPFTNQKSNEPLIVVEETGLQEEEEQGSPDREQTQQAKLKTSLDIDSPVNPYLLSPWRDPRETRKHSLPSQQVTEGITASQIRRLSEKGGEGSGPTPKEAAFLATLSQAPAPSGRRHSVVTISKVPPVLFGRNRRESVAALPNAGRVLSGSRRESATSVGPPSTDPLGSIHNLQLDIMDDIVQSRKARMKLWTTSSEKVCEVQVVDESGASSSAQRYTNRRFSDFIGIPTTPSFSRRASEHPAIVSPCVGSSTNTSQKRKKTGLLGSRSDLSSIFSNLTSSAMEINKSDDTPAPTFLIPSTSASASTSKSKPTTSTPNTLDPNVGRSTRSNSFDVSLLQNAKQFISDTGDKSAAELSGWFTKRHQPMAKKKSIRSKSTAMALSKDMLEKLQSKDVRSDFNRKSTRKPNKPENKSMDPHQIGSAIEGFLRKSTSSKGAIPKENNRKSGKSNQSKPSAVKSTMNWFTKGDEDDSKDTCDSSLCSTLKDLFVK